MRRCKVQASPVQTVISRLCHLIQSWTDPEYLCTKKQKSPSIYRLSRDSQSVTLTAMNSTWIFTYSLWIILVLSSCLLQRIILWNSSAPFPSECQSTWQILVSILTSFFQNENWSTNNPRNSPRCFTVWLWNVSENRNRNTESYSKPENEAVKFCSSWSYPLLDFPLCPFFTFMASMHYQHLLMGRIYWATSWKHERSLEHLLKTDFVTHLSFVSLDVLEYF